VVPVAKERRIVVGIVRKKDAFGENKIIYHVHGKTLGIQMMILCQLIAEDELSFLQLI
jgi:hypothetical protein